MWFAAAAALVAGIVIGFTSGYAAGKRGAPAPVAETLDPGPAAAPAEAATAGSGQAFSEAAVEEPERVDPEPVIVPEEPAVDRSEGSDRSSRPDRSNASNASHVPSVPSILENSAPGSVTVVSRPAGAQVVFDGRVLGRTPLSIPNVPAGTHSVRLELPGFNRWATSVDVNPGARARVAASLEQP